MNDHIALGAYVLGGLDPAEVREFEVHLVDCTQCRQELTSFAPVAARLNAVDMHAARALLAEPCSVPVNDPSAELLTRLRARRRNRRIALGAIAAAGVAASIASGVFLAPLLRPAPAPDAHYAVVSDAGLRVDLGLNAKAWGTELQFNGTDLPTNGTLSLWVVDLTGQADMASTWRATKTGKTRLSGAVPTELASISVIQLRDVDSKILAELSLPEGPSQLPG